MDLTQAKQKQAKMMNVLQPMLSMAVGVIWTTMTVAVSKVTIYNGGSFN
jgi:hypothetical protein